MPSPDPDAVAIVVPRLFQVSETFIARHIRELAPGRTAVVTFHPAGIDLFAGPALCLPDRKSNGWLGRKLQGVRTVLSRSPGVALSAAAIRRLLAFLREHGVTTMLAEYGPTGCEIAAACRQGGIRLFVYFHGADASLTLRSFSRRYAYRRLALEAAGLVTPSRFLAEKLAASGLPAARMRVIPCGVDVESFQPGADRDPHLVLAVGRLVEKKAPHLVVAAFAKAAVNHGSARLEIIGDGPLRETCRRAAERSGIANRIVLLGAQRHDVVRRKMAQAAVFVQHSVTAANGETEGLPVGILEAMASGLPVVATRHAGIPEAVVEGVSGLLVAEHDIDGMARALDRLLDDESWRAALGAAGRARACERFTASQSIAALRQFMGLSG